MKVIDNSKVARIPARGNVFGMLCAIMCQCRPDKNKPTYESDVYLVLNELLINGVLTPLSDMVLLVDRIGITDLVERLGDSTDPFRIRLTSLGQMYAKDWLGNYRQKEATHIRSAWVAVMHKRRKVR